MAITSAVHSYSSETLKLSKAVLFYTGNKNAYATVNDIIENEDGTQQIGAGVGATTESLGALATLLVNNVSLGGFLPETVLSVGINSVVWWCKPQTRRKIWFKTSNDQIGTRSAETPQPGLVFCVSDKGWSVYAVKGIKRPTPSTKLYQAPYFNVYSNGSICTGNILCPESSTQESLTEWETAFFNTFFTHPNVRHPEVLLHHKGGAFSFWKYLLNSNLTKFPESVLVDRKTTLADLLDKKAGK